MRKYLSATQTNNKTCYNSFAGTYFYILGKANDTSGASFLNGVYRAVQLFRDGRAYGNGLAELSTNESVGNLIGYWTCNEINSNLTHIYIERVVFFYDAYGRPNQATATQDLTCENTLKNCTGQGLHKTYYSQLPYNGQFHQPVAAYIIQPVLYFYLYLPPY